MVSTLRWKNDLASFNKLKREVKNFKSELSKGGGMFGALKGMNGPASKSLLAKRLKQEQQLADKVEMYGEDLVKKRLEKTRQAELKRENDLHKLKVSKDKELARKRAEMEKEYSRKATPKNIRSAVAGLTSSSGAGKASQSVFADQLRNEEKLAKKAQEFNKRKEYLIQMYLMSNKALREMNDTEKKVLANKLRQKETQQELRLSMRKELIERQKILEVERKATRQKNLQKILQDRMNASLKQMVGTLGSLYAGGAVLGGVTTTGQTFEGIESALLAVSENAVLAKQNLKFVQDEALRLGKPLKDSARSFSRMLAARGNLSVDQIKELFSSTQEMATVLGLTADENNRAMVAIGQMLSKGKITAEEL